MLPLSRLWSSHDSPINNTEHFLSLEIGESKIRLGLCEIIGETAKMVACEESPLANQDDFLTISSSLMAKIYDQIKNLPQSHLIKQKLSVIFGLSPNAVEENKIKPEFLDRLKQTSLNLNLKPLGFIVVSDAVTPYLQKIEGVPPTAILIYLTSKNARISVIRVGQETNIFNLDIIDKNSPLPQKIFETINSISDVEVLPSRILLYDDGANLENLKQKLLTYPWTNRGKFLHFPKIEALDRFLTIRAVADSVVSQKGKSLVFEQENKETLPAGFSEEQIVAEQISETSSSALPKTTKTDELIQRLNTKNPLLLGFLERIKSFPQSIFGFLVQSGPGFLRFFQKTIAGIGKIRGPKIALRSTLKPSKPQVLLATTLLLFVVLLGITSFWYFPKAKIKLYLKTQAKELETDLAVNPKIKGIDPQKKEIPALILETKLDGKKSLPTTGKKIIGEKAKGEITIYNRTEAGKTFAAGTVFLSGLLKFTLDSETTVASNSAYSTSLSKIRAKITASKIGAESNLSSGNNFTIGSFATNSYFAVNESSLSGGTSREVVAISKDDQEKLLQSLTEELRKNGKEELAKKANINLSDKVISASIVSQKFDKEIGSEGDEVTLEMTLKLAATSFDQESVKEILLTLLGKDLPSGFELVKDSLNLQTDILEIKKDGSLNLKAKASVKTEPKLDLPQIKKMLLSNPRREALKTLENLPGLQKTEIREASFLPLFFDHLPPRMENITIEIIR